MGTKKDAINPEHYLKFPITPSQYIRENDLGWYEGNAIKYITRHQDKNGAEDVKKAIKYMELILEEYENS